MVTESARVLDAGMVGTEQLYFLVGSRDLDGGLMCTASHNPKAYTGAKLVEHGALALVGRPWGSATCGGSWRRAWAKRDLAARDGRGRRRGARLPGGGPGR